MNLLLKWHKVVLIELVQVILSIDISAVRQRLLRETHKRLRKGLKVDNVLILFKVVCLRFGGGNFGVSLDS